MGNYTAHLHYMPLWSCYGLLVDILVIDYCNLLGVGFC